jgi:hypothetical protein
MLLFFVQCVTEARSQGSYITTCIITRGVREAVFVLFANEHCNCELSCKCFLYVAMKLLVPVKTFSVKRNEPEVGA